MKISVISPSYNQAQFLPFNLASVAAQIGVDVEHIIVDPGSNDGSTEIARKASNVRLIAEPDRGQSDGINKGFANATGDILVWLNSDDFYPDSTVLASVVQCFRENPDIDVVYGDVNFVDESGAFLRKGFVNKDSGSLLSSFHYQVGIVQPGVFWRRRVFESLGGPSEEFEYCMDYELWVRMASNGYKWKYLPKVLAHHRWWDGMKTSSRRDLSLREHFKVCDRYFGYVHWKWLDRYADFLCSRQDGVVNHAASIDPQEKVAAVRTAIDEVVTQECLRHLYAATHPEIVATRQYIEEHYPDKQRVFFECSELNVCSEHSEDPLADTRVAWNIFEAATTDGRKFSAYHVPDNFDRYFDKEWHDAQLRHSEKLLSHLRTTRRGDTCVIVGNGPSLRKSDLSLLEGVDVIMSNFAGLSRQLSQFAKILTVVNDLVAKQGAIDFNAQDCIKVVPFWLGCHFNADEKTMFVNATVRPEFGIDILRHASWRSTVSFFNMQLAYAIGYKKVLLIGFDHSYVQPQGVSEGTVISQKEDDENHFDPRYFKGKDWQAADTANMEKMYVVAKRAYEGTGRQIVNCTIGGKLEVFPRGDLKFELDAQSRFSRSEQSIPRLLMIDSTPVGHVSATGQLKQTFLEGWPAEAFLQIWEAGGQHSSLHAITLGETIEASRRTALDMAAVIKRCREFSPEVIYFRPIDSEKLFELAERLASELNKPVVVHMMDDWPERLRLVDEKKFTRLDSTLRRILARSSRRLSICDAMSTAFQSRYGGTWLPLANGADLSEFPLRSPQQRQDLSTSAPFVIRYMGALADNMTYASVKDIAAAVASLQGEYPVRLEIYTMDWCREKAVREMGSLDGVSVHALVDTDDYKRFLCEADALVIAYNFDAASIAYIGLSLANKMPECLASGAPLLAYGPAEVATIAYLRDAGCAQVVMQRDQALVRNALIALISQPEFRAKLVTAARNHVTSKLSKQLVQERFRDYLSVPVETPVSALIGPFARSQSAHYDETDCIAELYSGTLSGKCMIDVGAHYGLALQPFLDKGWQIFAFEPDEKNRSKLTERLAKHKNQKQVTLDIRCVSNESRHGVSFFRSEQSTGISGLSAFHESHVEAQRVDTTTLTEFFGKKSMPAVDFLKIDTEGHDLFVLKGFPWDRAKPIVIECEFEDSKTVPLGYTFHDLAKFLVDKGYTVYVSEWHPIVRYGIRHDWRHLMRYPCRLADTKAWGNLIAFREPIDENALANAVRKVLRVTDTPQTKASKPKPVKSASHELTLKPINLLFRNADFAAALNGYLALYRLRPMPMYLDNARMAARELGYTKANAGYDELMRLGLEHSHRDDHRPQKEEIISWIDRATAISPLTARSSIGEWGGENGILTEIFTHIPVQSGFCVEFGQSAIGSGTVAQLISDRGWGALYFDRAAQQAIQRVPTANGLGITLAQESVSADNINALFEKHKVPTDLDCLVIDIDGQDLWVWQSIDNKYRPSIVIIEYNAHIPLDIPASIRPDPNWVYRPSKDYGASFAALCGLAREKGYRLVHVHGCWNLFFIRSDLALPEHLTIRQPLSHMDFAVLTDTEGFYDALCGEGKRPTWFGTPAPDAFSSPWVLVDI